MHFRRSTVALVLVFIAALVTWVLIRPGH